MTEDTPRSIPMSYASVPVHKRAMGIAVGLIAAVSVFLVTAFHVALDAPSDGPNIWLLAQYFYGYEVTWRGAFVGAGWGFVTGFVLGWFLAFVRNLVVTLLAFSAMTEEETARTSRFLDHI